MSRYRLQPTSAQARALLEHCGHARFVGNLAVEQHSHWRPGRKRAPGFAEQCCQLTEARAEHLWQAAGSAIVRQQALKDFAQAMARFFGRTHRRPTWRSRGRGEGFRVVAVKPGDVRRVSRKVGEVKVPKVGWVRFRWSRPVAHDVRSYRVTHDRAGRWHVAFAVMPEPIATPGTGAVVGVDRGVVVSAALSTGELLSVPTLRDSEKVRLLRLQRSVKGTLEAPGRGVAQKAGLNRGILANGWGQLMTRVGHKAPGRVVKVDPRFTSQRCSACGIADRGARASQAAFRCRSCGFACNADVNAAVNIRLAAGHAVTARRGPPLGEPANREPRRDLLFVR